MAIKAHPANVGKQVIYRFRRGGTEYQRLATIVRFRGGFASTSNQTHSAFVKVQEPNGNFRIMGVELSQLEYVK